jgi:hypothetical protein
MSSSSERSRTPVEFRRERFQTRLGTYAAEGFGVSEKVLMCLGNLSSHVVVLKLITIQITE